MKTNEHDWIEQARDFIPSVHVKYIIRMHKSCNKALQAH